MIHAIFENAFAYTMALEDEMKMPAAFDVSAAPRAGYFYYLIHTLERKIYIDAVIYNFRCVNYRMTIRYNHLVINLRFDSLLDSIKRMKTSAQRINFRFSIYARHLLLSTEIFI